MNYCIITYHLKHLTIIVLQSISLVERKIFLGIVGGVPFDSMYGIFTFIHLVDSYGKCRYISPVTNF